MLDKNVAALCKSSGRADDDFDFDFGMLDGERFGECFSAACGDGVVGVDDED